MLIGLGIRILLNSGREKHTRKKPFWYPLVPLLECWTGIHKQLKMTVQRIGANTVGTIFTGLIAKDSQQKSANNI
jgi:hypothetical protein